MKKTIVIIAVAVVVLGGGTVAYMALRDDKTVSSADSTANTTDSMSAMDMSKGESSQNSGSTGSSQDTGTAGTTGSSDSGNASSAVSTDKVKIANYAFSPATITVKVGTKVTWTNGDVVQHNIAMDDEADGPSSQMLSKGDTYTYTFNKAGTYNYHCTPHPYMKATVIVTE